MVKFYQHYIKRHNMKIKITLSWEITPIVLFYMSTIVTYVQESFKRLKISTRQHGVTPRKTAMFVVTTLKTSRFVSSRVRAVPLFLFLF